MEAKTKKTPLTGPKPTPIPQTDPLASYLAHRIEIDDAIRRVLESGRYVLGQEVEAFERELAAYLGVNHAAGVGNGTDALEIALRALEIGPGDLVFTVSHTAVATVAAIELTGATPVLVDIDPAVYTMDPNSLEFAITHAPPGRIRAVVPVHLYGQPVDMHSILELARKHGLFVIEDCAQSHGATIGGSMTGSFGELAAFSFYPTKNLGGIGDGGAVVTNDPQLAEKVHSLRQYGWRERYVSCIPGKNTRLDELQAAILRVKLKHLDTENKRRRDIAMIYTSLLADSGLSLPMSRANTLHVYHQYVICARQRDALRSYLSHKDVGTLVHYPVPVHLQAAYRARLPLSDHLQHTERIAQQVLSLPVFPQLSNSSIQYASQCILSFNDNKKVPA